MPRYTLSGVDREDGGTRFTTVYADNQDDAINKAGFIVEKVEIAPDVVAAPAVRASAGPPPTYLAILVFAGFAIAIGYVVAVLGVFVGVFTYLDTDKNSTPNFNGFLFAINAVPGGLFLALLGELLRGFRDMARNSFR